jgi:beta-galactosidase
MPAERWFRRLGGIGFGGDYNPEQWPEDVWAEDMTLMKAAGVTVVSVGIFSWARVQPRPGEFDWGWFDRVMDNLAGQDIMANLATMTASPPPWLAARWPETLPVRADGVRLSPGARQQYCPSSTTYRSHAANLVERLAERYADHPALGLWHIGNEYGCHVPACYCDASAHAFRRWLLNRYGDMATLNDAWSTSFWSQRYDSFDEIAPPRVAPTFPNPAQQIDYARFSSDELMACYLMEKEIVGRHTPQVPVTTNLLSVARTLDYFRWAAEQDVISHDSYPDPHDPDAHLKAAYAYDLMRSLKHGQPWLLMEQAPSAVNWRRNNAAKRPGQMRLWSYQAVARGADAVLYFQWRQSRGGAEKYHSAMVPHGGQQTRIWREVSGLGRELAGLADVAGSRVRAEVALILDWSSWWGLEVDSHPSAALRQNESSYAHYTPLHLDNVTVDVVHPSWDLSGYRLVVVPNLYLVDDSCATNLTEYVRGGGHLVMSFFSGIVDEHDRVWLGGYPAPFRDVLGLWVEEFWPLAEGELVDLAAGDVRDAGPAAAAGSPPATAAAAATGSMWSEAVHVEGADVVATFATGDLAGQPAVTRNRFGAGVAWYLATRPDLATMRALLRRAAVGAGVRAPAVGVPDGVEVVTRYAADGARYRFVLNHTDGSVPVPLDGAQPLLGGDTDSAGQLVLPPRGVTVLRQT